MQNKLLITPLCVEVRCDAQDTDTQLKVAPLYPAHTNRTRTSHRVSPHRLPEILALLRGLTVDNIDTAPAEIQDLFAKEMHTRDTMKRLLQDGPVESPRVNDYLTLMRHQQLGREIANVRDRYGFFLDTRLGKTPLSLAIIYDDLQLHPDNTWLIIAPLILLDNAWIPDAKEFVPELSIVNCHAATKEKRVQLLHRNANIFITNTESFAAYQEYFEAKNFAGCIVDESSSMKSSSSKAAKALVDYSQKVPRWYLLSGRPAPNGNQEYYMQLKSIDYYCVAQSYSQFKKRFFINTSYNPQWEKLEANPDTLQELKDVIASNAIYIDQSVLTTAGKTYIPLELDMPADLKKIYNKLKNDFAIKVQEVDITAVSAGAVYNKLRQVSSGFIIDTHAVKANKFYDEDAQEVYLLSPYRFEALGNLLDKHYGEQVIIWAQYHAEFDEIQKLLGNKCAIINGTVSLEEKTTAIADFKEGRVQYLVAHPKSAKFGLTLTNCHICVYFSMSFSYEDWKQSSERIYGSISKQPKHCYYYILLTKGGIDKRIYEAVLNGKAPDNKVILDYLQGGGTSELP